MGVPLADVDRIAIGRRTGDAADGDAAASTADVFDHDRLSEPRPHMLGQNARRNIGRSARRERNDERDLTRWIGLRLYRRDAGQCRQRERNSELFHDRHPR